MTVQKDTLLIVDDIPANISVLFEFLNKENFKVLVAQDGKRAIEKARYASPDLILMDVMMPGMNGFDACIALKEDEETQHIPIIFMTALADTVDKVKGFSLGAADYITKPFQHEEVLARIKTHLQICRLQKETSRQTAELQVKNQQLEAFARTVAHDLKSPLNVVIGYADLLISDCETLCSNNQEVIDQLKIIIQSGEKMVSIIDSLLLLARTAKDDIELHPVDMGSIIEQVIQHRLVDLLKQYNGIIHKPDNWPIIQTYAPWVEEIWANYLSNGLKYGGRPPELELGATKIGDYIKFWIKDNGEGLSAEAKVRLFTPFTRLHENRAEGHGLGLSIVQQVVEKLGGKAGVETELGQGSTFYFCLPN